MKRLFAIMLFSAAVVSCGKSPDSSTSKAAPETLYCIAGKVNIRQHPDRGAAVTGSVKEGEAVEVTERSTVRTEVTLKAMGYIPAGTYTGQWLKIKTPAGLEGWAHSAFFMRRYFSRPDKNIAGLPFTTGATYDNKTRYYSPDLYIIGCSPSGLIAYMYYPTENPACGSSYFYIVNPGEKREVYTLSHCDIVDVWDIYSFEINRKLNEYEIQPADFVLEKSPGQPEGCGTEFSLKLRRRRGVYEERVPWRLLPVTGWSLVRERGDEKSVVAEMNCGKDAWYGNVLLAGFIRNPCTEKYLAVIISVQVGEEFTFIEVDTGCPATGRP